MSRSTSLAFAGLSFVVAAGRVGAQDAKAHFAYFGPLAQFLPEGKAPGIVSSGLPFSIRISDGGKAVSGGPFELKVPGADKPLKLNLNGLKIDGGKVSAQASIENTTGTAVEGVRLDVTGTIETYRAKDDQGKEILKTRPQKVTIASPLHFGDIADTANSGDLPLEAGTIVFSPETDHVDVTGLVSGLRFVRTLSFGDAATGGQIEVDAKGRVYLASTAGNQVARIDGDGKNLTVAAKLPDQCKGMAINPKTGDIAANCANNPKIFIFTAGGEDKSSIGEAQGVDNYPDRQRFDSGGNLWSNVSTALWKFGPDGKPTLKLTKAGDYDINASSGFDIGPDGSIYIITENTLFKLTPDGKAAKRVALGPGVLLAQLVNPSSVRVDPLGCIYVTEQEGDNGSSASRISVFDKAGNFVRAFGRGAKSPAPNFPDEYYLAQVFNPMDVAFGPDAKVYVSTSFKGDAGGHVMVFQPF